MTRKPQRCTRCNQAGHNARTCSRRCACGRVAVARVGVRLYCESCARLLRPPAKDDLL